jgi:hypothetical protein
MLLTTGNIVSRFSSALVYWYKLFQGRPAIAVRPRAAGCGHRPSSASGLRQAPVAPGCQQGAALAGWWATPDPAGARPAGRPGQDRPGVAVKGILYRYTSLFRYHSVLFRYHSVGLSLYFCTRSGSHHRKKILLSYLHTTQTWHLKIIASQVIVRSQDCKYDGRPKPTVQHGYPVAVVAADSLHFGRHLSFVGR